MTKAALSFCPHLVQTDDELQLTSFLSYLLPGEHITGKWYKLNNGHKNMR